MAIGALPQSAQPAPPAHPAQLAQPGRFSTAEIHANSWQRDRSALTDGIGQARFNAYEVTSLGNYLEQSRQLELRLREGGIDENERRQLQDRLDGYQGLVDQYTRGEYYPAPGRDDPFQNPRQALDGLGLTEDIQRMRDSSEPWTADKRRVYRQATDWQAQFGRGDHRGGDARLGPPLGGPQGPPQPVASFKMVTDTGKANFAAWDSDHNGSLSSTELNSAMADKTNTGMNALTLATLRKNHEALSRADGQEGLSVTDLEAFENGSARPELGFGDANRSLLSMMARGAGKDELGTIDPAALKQGVVGSCMLLSGLSSMSAEDVGKMIRDNQDGTYTVTFANGKEATVPQPTEAERLSGAHGGDGGYWPIVIESALGKVIGERDGRDPRAAMERIQGPDLIEHLAGQPLQSIGFHGLSHNDARDRLAGLDFDRGPIVACSLNVEGIPPEFAHLGAMQRLDNGIINNHAYAVLDFNRETNMVTLRNPHGQGELYGADTTNDGTFQMPFDRFYASFGGVVHGQDPGC